MSKDFLAGLASVRAKRQKREADNLLAPKRSGDEDSEENEKKARWKGLDEEEDDDGGEYTSTPTTRANAQNKPRPPPQY